MRGNPSAAADGDPDRYKSQRWYDLDGVIASVGMKPIARASAMANFLFNTVGVFLFFPFLAPFSHVMVESFGEAGMAVAWSHLIFNLTVELLLLSTLRGWSPALRRGFPLMLDVRNDLGKEAGLELDTIAVV